VPSSTVENYLKQIYLEQQHAPDQPVPTGRVADLMGVVPGTATSMIKTLADSGLVDYEPRGGTRLTRGGEQLALHVLRRHRLVELFLVKTLGLDWSEVHQEAEELEHSISEKVLERIDALLGHPQTDPHGDPIPSSKGHLPEARLPRLCDCKPGASIRIARVVDQDPPFLKFVKRCGLNPGTIASVLKCDVLADAIVVRLSKGKSITLGTAAAAKILVEQL
jgi:DtxR family Mn-dependent transcriptional regulator